ncbi:putative zinc-binding metallopeptidase [Thiothrix litoralis]|uniref:Zinc-binding metallopeptidase n=1 Tax=Thiothrix litoralis TaxID=2891210 RepID=A0ABX7WWL3_9GAMM|nr:putative zinc-binding metallopeptidase [Thiothrix litoralis]QTR48020.1 putative zinc-binding metallopeptidase [Thiothrix litoralis]
MRRFHCVCGHEVFFEDSKCSSCHSLLGFNPETLTMVVLNEDPTLRACALRNHPVGCNWMVAEDDDHEQCRSCRLTRTVPQQNIPINVQRWKVLEYAKRRLVYSFIMLGLPVVSREQDPDSGLAFDFLEDQRTNPLVKKRVVYTGHHNGLITLHVSEADDAYRVKTREQMNESYRTVLGHMRHEIGHYYWDKLIRDSVWYPRFRHMFGGEENYRESMDNYYAYGPVPNWEKRHISAYASAHPWEDWAETWAHYLHIMDTLETATDFEVIHRSTSHSRDFHLLMGEWRQLTLMMNALNRSMGQRDPYPFSLSRQVIVKLRFIHQLVAGSESA